jgi:hypothetical protein
VDVEDQLEDADGLRVREPPAGLPVDVTYRRLDRVRDLLQGRVLHLVGGEARKIVVAAYRVLVVGAAVTGARLAYLSTALGTDRIGVGLARPLSLATTK